MTNCAPSIEPAAIDRAPPQEVKQATLQFSARASMTPKFGRSKRSIRDILALKTYQREQAKLRVERLRIQADPNSADSALAAKKLAAKNAQLAQLQARISELLRRAPVRREARIELPTLCGSRPYFPAAP